MVTTNSNVLVPETNENDDAVQVLVSAENQANDVSPVSWQTSLLAFLNHTNMQIAIVLLLVVDLLLVIIGSAIEIQFLDSKLRDLELRCVGAEGGFTETEFELAGDHRLELSKQITELISLLILFIFLGESILQIVARGLSYFKSFSVMFDGAIVVTSIVLEIIYEDNSNAGLIILARLWRYIRLAHGAHEALHRKSHMNSDGNDSHGKPIQKPTKQQQTVINNNDSFSDTSSVA